METVSLILNIPLLALQNFAGSDFPNASPHTIGTFSSCPALSSMTSLVSFFAPWWGQFFPVLRLRGFSRLEPWDLRPQTEGWSSIMCAEVRRGRVRRRVVKLIVTCISKKVFGERGLIMESGN